MEINPFILILILILSSVGVFAIVCYVCERMKQPLGLFRRPKIEDSQVRAICKQCKYDLAGLPNILVCPECGTSEPDIWPKYRREFSSSRSRVALAVTISATSPMLMGWSSSTQWKLLWSATKWGPRPHFAVLPDLYHIAWAGWIFYWMLLLAQLCPWNAKLWQLFTLWLGGTIGILFANAAATSDIWNYGRTYMMSQQGRVQDTPLVVAPHVPIMGLGIGLLLAAIGVALCSRPHRAHP
jgi:hypothetical protein